MGTEHILQFAISIDDETIKSSIEKRAIEKLSDELLDGVKKSFGVRTTWQGDNYVDSQIMDIVTDTVKKICKDHEDEIVANATKIAAEKLTRTKSFKEKVEATMEKEDTNND